MHVVHDGPRQAPPLVLIHGSGASSGSWSPVVPALADRYHVIRIDLPGHGQSPPASSYDVPEQAGSLAAALDELDLGPITLVAHSSGGYKHAAQLVRFDHAAHLLAAGNAAAWVAAASGYVDQSHLHREVKAFTGATPTAVAAAPWLAIDDVAWPTSFADVSYPLPGG
ncbi:alpha/beta fold hydrolase [Streptomyces sp. DSM 15324]|uniref:alpha/beta fold hydrolase n=1 Tax=Streptomyces sp. DSM 15324 TaxID=1739111 RepID=UPI001F34A343|nr:alpha/beta fold hydrolase [Streptomyces sp. DSM 15324]